MQYMVDFEYQVDYMEFVIRRGPLHEIVTAIVKAAKLQRTSWFDKPAYYEIVISLVA